MMWSNDDAGAAAVAGATGVTVMPDGVGVATPFGLCVATGASAVTNVPEVDEPSVALLPFPVVLTGASALTTGGPDVAVVPVVPVVPEDVGTVGTVGAVGTTGVAGRTTPLGLPLATGASALTNVPEVDEPSVALLPFPVVLTGASALTTGDPDVPDVPDATGTNRSVRPSDDASTPAGASDSGCTDAPDADVPLPVVATGTVVPEKPDRPDNNEVVGTSASTGAPSPARLPVGMRVPALASAPVPSGNSEASAPTTGDSNEFGGAERVDVTVVAGVPECAGSVAEVVAPASADVPDPVELPPMVASLPLAPRGATAVTAADGAPPVVALPSPTVGTAPVTGASPVARFCAAAGRAASHVVAATAGVLESSPAPPSPRSVVAQTIEPIARTRGVEVVIRNSPWWLVV